MKWMQIKTILTRFFKSKTGESTYCMENETEEGSLFQIDGREGEIIVRKLTEDRNMIYRGKDVMGAARRLNREGKLVS